ncbi:MAG: RluA family pseudouridine synthase [Clostridiaceae bacterium]|nr:RluA family pseudouridine synthase [Clostridiaceae bacterium]
MFEIRLTENEAGQRADRFLRKYLKDYSLGDIYKLFRKNKVKLNGKRVKESQMLGEGDLLQLYIEKPEAETIQDISLSKPVKSIDLIYEDDNIIIVNKPAGLLTHPDKPGDTDTLIGRVLQHIYTQEGAGKSRTFSPAACNRLDRNTVGIVIVAKNYKTLKAVNSSIRERGIRKLYLCIAAGKMGKSGEMKGFLEKDQDRNLVSIKENGTGDGKQIHTIFRTLGVSDRIAELGKQFSLLEAELVTGRSHQIRAHFAYLEHPLAGDAKYGDNGINEYFRKRYNLRHQFLYAYKVVFEDVHADISYLKGRSFSSRLKQEDAFIVSSLFGMEGI